jgi:SET domain-containing protein
VDRKGTLTGSRTSKVSSRVRRDVAPGASRFRLKVRRSPIHRWGVFAAEAIPARREVIEYVGERIPYSQILRNHKRRWRSGLRSELYLLRLDRRWVIDGSVGGNGSELINHCCDPNLAHRRVSGRIVFFSRRKIKAGEEFTLDYQFHEKAERISCHCRSTKCRGTINMRPAAARR